MAYKSKKLRIKNRNKMIKKFFFLIFIPIFTFFVLSVLLFNHSFLKINEIKIVGNKNIKSEEIRNLFTKGIRGKYLEIYDKNNFLIYPENIIEYDILKKIKTIKEVSISYIGFSRNIEISVLEREAEYLFCKEEECYFSDKNSLSYSKFNDDWYNKKKEEYIIFSQEEEKKEEEKDLAPFLNKSDLEKIKKLIINLKNIDLKVIEIRKKYFGEFILTIKGGVKIVIFIDQDFSKISESLKKISEKDDLKIDKTKGGFKKEVIYINLSYGEIIHYCMKGDLCQNNY